MSIMDSTHGLTMSVADQVGQIDDQVVTFVSNHNSDFNQAVSGYLQVAGATTYAPTLASLASVVHSSDYASMTTELVGQLNTLIAGKTTATEIQAILSNCQVNLVNSAATATVKASLNATDNSQLDMSVEINRTQALAKTSDLGLNLNSAGVDNVFSAKNRDLQLVTQLKLQATLADASITVTDIALAGDVTYTQQAGSVSQVGVLALAEQNIAGETGPDLSVGFVLNGTLTGAGTLQHTVFADLDFQVENTATGKLALGTGFDPTAAVDLNFNNNSWTGLNSLAPFREVAMGDIFTQLRAVGTKLRSLNNVELQTTFGLSTTQVNQALDLGNLINTILNSQSMPENLQELANTFSAVTGKSITLNGNILTIPFALSGHGDKVVNLSGKAFEESKILKLTGNASLTASADAAVSFDLSINLNAKPAGVTPTTQLKDLTGFSTPQFQVEGKSLLSASATNPVGGLLLGNLDMTIGGSAVKILRGSQYTLDCNFIPGTLAGGSLTVTVGAGTPQTISITGATLAELQTSAQKAFLSVLGGNVARITVTNPTNSTGKAVIEINAPDDLGLAVSSTAWTFTKSTQATAMANLTPADLMTQIAAQLPANMLLQDVTQGRFLLHQSTTFNLASTLGFDTASQELGLLGTTVRQALIGSKGFSAAAPSVHLEWTLGAATTPNTFDHSIDGGTLEEMVASLNQALKNGSNVPFVAEVFDGRVILTYTGTDTLTAFSATGLSLDGASKEYVVLSRTLPQGRINQDLVFDVTLGTQSTQTLRVLAQDLSANMSYADLVADLNAVISANTLLKSKVEAQLRGKNQIVIQTLDSAHGDLMVSFADATLASRLGFASGVNLASSADMSLTIAGVKYEVDFSGMNLTTATMQDVLTKIQAACTSQGGAVTINGLELSANGQTMTIVDSNGRNFAALLGLNGTGTTLKIQGRSGSGASAQVSIQNLTVTSSYSLLANQLQVAAVAGPLEITLAGSVDVKQAATATWNTLTNSFDVQWSDLKTQNGTTVVPGKILELNVTASGLATSTPLGTVSFGATLDSTKKLTLPVVSATWSAEMGSLLSTHGSMGGLLTSLATALSNNLLELVVNNAMFTAQNTKIPILGRSVGQLLPLATKAEALMQTLNTNHPATLQELNRLIQQNLGANFTFAFTLKANQQLEAKLAWTETALAQKTLLGGMSFGSISIGGDAEAYTSASFDVTFTANLDLTSGAVAVEQASLKATVTAAGDNLAFDLSIGDSKNAIPMMQVVSSQGASSYLRVKGGRI